MGVPAAAGAWVRLPDGYGGAEARWTAGKGEGGVELRAGPGSRPLGGTIEKDGYHRFRWGGRANPFSMQRGRLYAWLKTGRALEDKGWQAHHGTLAKEGRHVKRGGRVTPKDTGKQSREHGVEGARASAENRRKKKAMVRAKVSKMNAGRPTALPSPPDSACFRITEDRGLGFRPAAQPFHSFGGAFGGPRRPFVIDTHSF